MTMTIKAGDKKQAGPLGMVWTSEKAPTFAADAEGNPWEMRISTEGLVIGSTLQGELSDDQLDSVSGGRTYGAVGWSSFCAQSGPGGASVPRPARR